MKEDTMKKQVISLLISGFLATSTAAINTKVQDEKKKNNDLVTRTVNAPVRPIVIATAPRAIPAELAQQIVKKDAFSIADMLAYSTQVSMYSFNEDGKIDYLASGIARKNEFVNIVYDFIAYRPVEYKGAMWYVGVGTRVTATIRVNEKNVKLGGLFNLGIAVSQSKISGTIQVEVLGIQGESIANLLPVATELSRESILAAVQAATTIKSQIYRKDVQVTPVLLATELSGQGGALAEVPKVIGGQDFTDGGVKTLSVDSPKLLLPVNQKQFRIH